MLRCLVASWPRCFPCKPGSRFLCDSRFTFHGPRSQTVHGSRSQLTVHCSRTRQTAHTINNKQKQLHNTKQQAQPTTTTLHSYMSCLTCFLYDLATSPPSHQAFKKGAGGMGPPGGMCRNQRPHALSRWMILGVVLKCLYSGCINYATTARGG